MKKERKKSDVSANVEISSIAQKYRHKLTKEQIEESRKKAAELIEIRKKKIQELSEEATDFPT